MIDNILNRYASRFFQFKDNNNSMEDTDKKIQDIKKDFYSLRNGMVADSLKTIYPKEKLIYGLTVPEFISISQKYSKDKITGLKLWADKRVRESRIFALYMIPVDTLTMDEAVNMVLDVDGIEEGEMLAFRILRHLPYRKALYSDLSLDENISAHSRYCLEMLKKNIEKESELS